MTLEVLPMVAVLVGLTLYTLLGGADLGAGLWQLFPGRAGRAPAARAHAFEAIGPVWEANHVWLVFVLTVFWTAYPAAFGDITTTLVVPLSLAGVGIVLRGTSYALHGATPGRGDPRAVVVVFGVSSVLTPFALGAAVGAIAAGRVPAGDVATDPFGSWLRPTPLLVGVLAVVVGAHLAAVQLASAARHRDAGLVELFRRRALLTGVLAGVLAVAALLVARRDAPALYSGLLSGGGLLAVLVSLLAGLTSLLLLTLPWIGAARVAAGLAIAALVAGWALAQQPEVLPGLSITQAAAPRDTLLVVTGSIVVGGLIVLPCLVLLFRLVLTERFSGDPRPAGSVPPGAPPEPRPVVGRVAAVLFVGGAGLLAFGPGAASTALGVLGLAGAAVLGFTAVAPVALGDEPRTVDR